MNLVMFDIDGTLVEWNPVFDDLYVEAVKEYLNIPEVDTNWKRYRNSTDSDITAQIIEENLERPATTEDIKIIRNSYVKKVQSLTLDNPDYFHEIAGAGEILTELINLPDINLAIATGNWEETSLIKLKMNNLFFPELTIATASDALSRDGIMKKAEERVKQKFQNTSINSIVYIGDAVWDIRASVKNDYHFIGIATGEKVAQFRNEGAKWIIPDNSDKEKFFSILKEIWNTS